jgi:hypothetical protein
MNLVMYILLLSIARANSTGRVFAHMYQYTDHTSSTDLVPEVSGGTNDRYN